MRVRLPIEPEKGQAGGREKQKGEKSVKGKGVDRSH